MSLVTAMGETEEFGGRETVMDSFYPVRLHVGDLDTTPVRDEDTDSLGRPKGGTPYVQLSGEVTDGPFEGATVSSRYYMTPGGPDSKGGFIMKLNSACQQITGMPANEAAAVNLGFSMPPPEDGEDDREHGKRVRAEFRDFFAALDPADRMDLMVQYLRLASWDGKVVVAHISIEEGETRPDGSTPLFNRWEGFYNAKHPDKGMAYVKGVCFQKQEAELAAQDASA